MLSSSSTMPPIARDELAAPSRGRWSLPSTPNTVPLSARMADLASAIADKRMQRADAADLAASPAEQLFRGCRARAMQQHVTLVDQAGADEHLGDLADHAVADREDHDLGLEQHVGRRR